MTSSHSGEDVHVRTLQAHVPAARASRSRCWPAAPRGCRSTPLTAARLARDGERPSAAAPHVLRPALGVRAARQARRLGARDVLAGRPPGAGGRARGDRRRLRGRAGHASRPASTAAASSPTPSRCARSPGRTRSSPTPRASRPATRGPRSRRTYVEIRDAMLAHPELVAGTRDRLDTSLMKAAARPVRQQERVPRGCAASGSCAEPAATARRRPGSRSRSRTATARIGGRGRRPSRRCGRSACSRARRFASSPATTGRRPSTRTAGWRPSRSRTFELAPVGELVPSEPGAMTFQGDPYRTLGIVAGASLNEIRSAYRRLAKQYHPDAAGDRALPRFLAIQAAYERLVDSGGAAPAGGRRGLGDPQGSESWRADATRARASREAWRARRAGATSTGGAPGPAGTASKAKPGTGGAGGSGGRRRRQRDGRGRRRRGAAEGAPHAGAPRARRRPGSTSYDEADGDPARSRAGRAARGTARRRARTGRSTRASTRTPASTGPNTRPAPVEPPRSGAPTATAARPPRRLPARPPPPSPAGPGAAVSPRPPMAAMRRLGRARLGIRGAGASTTPGRRPWRARAGRSAASPTDGYPADAEPLPDLEAVARKASPRNLLALARRPGWRWRLVIALIAWPPVGYGVGAR